jgi:aryl-alcohol dehydrogenase-like predicted oxidoreductase
MNLRSIGNSSLLVSPIGLGTWQFSQASGFHKYFWSDVSQNTMNDIIKNSIENGINWFDTAELYGSGKSERALSQALKSSNISSDIIIATKWNPILRRSKTISKTFSKRISNLAPYPIDLHQIHNPYSLSSLKNQLLEMHKLLVTKEIKAIGVSNFSLDKMEKSFSILENLGSTLASNQVKYSIFDRSIETDGLIDNAKELGISIIAYSPLEQGLATGIYHKNEQLLKNVPFIRKRSIKRKFKKTSKAIQELDLIANELKTTIAQISLNWLINQHGDTVLAIPGASKVSQAISNANAMKITLSKEQMNSIDILTQDFL